MALQSFVRKSILLIFLISILFGLVVVSTPVADADADNGAGADADATSSFYSNGRCRSCLQQCKNPLIRKEWHTLSDTEKKNYLKAVNCLAHKPSLPALHAKYPGTINRLDDFTAVHCNQSDYIHFTGYFFPWHRYFVGVFEKALREECGYKGAQPYWNISKDVATEPDMNKWIIFANDTGFGGNGPYVSHAGIPNPYNLQGTGGGCVPAGPFGAGTTFRVNLPLGTDTSTNNPRCLVRDFDPYHMFWSTQSRTQVSLNQPTYFDFHKSVQVLNFSIPAIHGGPHWGIGGVLGEMTDFFKSPSDPLFYMHHTNLDRIYAQWESLNPEKRLCEIGGPVVPGDYSLTQGPALTLDFKINIDVMGPPTALGDLLNTRAGPFCYVYEGIP